MDIVEAESVVRNIIETSSFEYLRLTLVEREFVAVTKFRLKDVATQNGFSSIGSMIQTWTGFQVAGKGFLTNVKVEATLPAARHEEEM